MGRVTPCCSPHSLSLSSYYETLSGTGAEGPLVLFSTAVLLFLCSYFIPATKSIFILLPRTGASTLERILLGIQTAVSVHGTHRDTFFLSLSARGGCVRGILCLLQLRVLKFLAIKQQYTHGPQWLSSKPENNINVITWIVWHLCKSKDGSSPEFVCHQILSILR